MTSRYQLVKDQLSHDTIECAEAILRQAKAGQLVGLAFVAMRPRSEDGFVHICGAALKRRATARGLVQDLNDILKRDDC